MRCNIYGAERQLTQPYGGITGQQTITTQPVCTAPAIYRCRWACEHGHQGVIINVCEMHYAEMNGLRRATFEGGEGQWREFNGRQMAVPYNLRRQVQTCYACAAQAQRPEDQHKCEVKLVRIS